MSHADAALTTRSRLRRARLIVEDGWPVTAAAEMVMVSPVTARTWAARYRSEGPAGMADRVTGEPIRRYEHPHPGSLIHVDVTTFANIPDGGGHRFVGRQQGQRNQFTTPGLPKGADDKPRLDTAFVHTVIDDHSRVAYLEICTDEKAVTAAAVLRRAVTRFAQRGVTVERVLSDNGSCYRSTLWKATCADLAITPKRTRPYRPQTNGKIERFHRTLADGWAYARHYQSDSERRDALDPWMHFYNHHRTHSAIGGTPISRLNNLPEHHT